MKQKQLKFWNNSSLHVNRQMDSFTKLMHLSNHLPTNPHVLQLSMPQNKAEIEKRCSLQIRNVNSATIPTLIAPNVWILTSGPTAVLTGITLICPDEAPRFIKTQTPIHILCLPPACSHYILKPPSTMPLWNSPANYQYTCLNTGNLNMWWIFHIQTSECGNI